MGVTGGPSLNKVEALLEQIASDVAEIKARQMPDGLETSNITPQFRDASEDIEMDQVVDFVDPLGEHIAVNPRQVVRVTSQPQQDGAPVSRLVLVDGFTNVVGHVHEVVEQLNRDS